MKKLNPFFIIGTTGMIITAILHIFMALVLSMTSVHQSFFIIYPSFLAFLVIGAAQMRKTSFKV